MLLWTPTTQVPAGGYFYSIVLSRGSLMPRFPLGAKKAACFVNTRISTGAMGQQHIRIIYTNVQMAGWPAAVVCINPLYLQN